MAYLVTGGAGFIGSNLVGKLLEDGKKVIVIDNFSSGKIENLAFPENTGHLKIVTRSICDNLNDIFKNEKIDAVFHLAANPSVPYSIEHPSEVNEINVNGTLNLLECCRKHGVKRFIFSSSCAVYGNQDSLPFVETMTPNPMSPYALSKLMGEQYCRLYHFLYGLEAISLRYFNVFGPKQNPQGNYACMIPRFINIVKEGKTPTINGDGRQTRDFVYVSDIVDANLSALITRNKKCFGEVFNIGTGKNISVNEVTENIIKLSKNSIKLHYGPAVIEPRNALADTKMAESILNFEPKVEFKEGLEKTYNYFASTN